MSDSVAPFVPPHCPRSDCPYHVCATGWRWARHGWYTRQAAPQRVRRFRCAHCGHTFSEQSFRTDYWLRRPDVLAAIARRLLGCSGYRQLARELACSHPTVMAQARRLGRHALLWLWGHRPQGPLREPVVVDGFESFAFSQYQPLYLNLVVGADSHYLYGFTHTRLRRKGRMTAAQKRRRAALERTFGRPDPRGIELDTAEALRLAAPRPQPLVVRSDEHADYPRALERLRRAGYALRHECTPSVRARTAGNPLFPVNRQDLWLRHAGANHKRETIAFSKRHQAVLERAAWQALWLNWTKPFSENHGGGTPAMRAGLARRPVPVRELLARRGFPLRVCLPEPWAGYYWSSIPTPGIANERRHAPRLAG
jgi:transposase-like protein